MKCKHIRQVFGLIAVLATVLSCAATTETVNGITWTYTVNNGSASVGGGGPWAQAIPAETSGAIEIPPILGGYTVTGIGDYAFPHCTKLTRVTIPASVTSIGDSAFNGCSGLTSVTIPDGVTSVGDSAFYGCSGLTSLTIPDSVTSIGSQAFYGCNSLRSVMIPNSVTNVGYSAFNYCSAIRTVMIPQCICTNRLSNVFPDAYKSITEVIIAEGVTRIGDWEFYDCDMLSSISILDGVLHIGEYAFNFCGRLNTVTMPNSITSIGTGAFSNCKGLVSVTIPQYVCNSRLSSIFPSAYQNITNVVIVDGVTSIGPSTFDGCGKIECVTISDDVMSIGPSAFNGCSGLTSILIPRGVNSIGSLAFGNCRGLMMISVASGNNAYLSNNGLLLSKNGQTLIQGVNGDVTIPDGVMSIGNFAFYGCSGLTSVAIPGSVTSIGSSAFYGCSGLTSVTIPDGVTSVGDSAFYGCNRLTSVTIPTSVINIGNRAFDGCYKLMAVNISDIEAWCRIAFGRSNANPLSCANNLYLNGELLTDLLIPDEVSRIGAYAFTGYTRLASVTIPSSVTNVDTSAFSGCSGLVSVTIPQCVCTNRLSATFPAAYQSITNVVFADCVTNIGGYAFSGCAGFTSVLIPDSVKSIGDYAFSGCTGLTSVAMHNSVMSVGYRAFYGCSRLMSMTVPQCLCSSRFSVDFPDIYQSITNVVIADGVTNIASSAFSDCSGLMGVTMPSSVANIGYRAFYGCSSLADANGYIILRNMLCGYVGNAARVVIANGVTSIEAGVFSGCTRLTSVTFPNSLMRIGDNAFSYCSGLTSVTIPYGVTNIADGAFEKCDSLASILIPRGCVVGSKAIPNNTTVTQYKPVQTVHFDAAGGMEVLTSVTVRRGDIYGVLPSPIRAGYSFAGWKYGNTVVVKGTIVTALDDHTLIAQWTPCRYVMTFDANGGVGGKKVTQDCGSSLSAPTVTRTGYTFVGWSPSVPSAVPAENATYTAQWQINQYTMTFDANGGVGGKTIVLDYGSPLSAPAVTREGHTFNGWSPSVPSTVPAGNATYTAQWLVNKYTVTFNANGGTCGTAELSVDYGASVGELPVPVRDNAVFLGWFTEAEGGVKVDADTVVTGELVLYAHWLFEVESPVVVSSEGNPFRADSCEVSIECATEGAAIYYTDDGTTPRLNDDYLYTGPFTITDTTVIKAIAVVQELRSGYVTTTIEKHTLTFEEALGSVEGVAFATGGDALWSPIVYDAAKRGDICAKSGAIGNKAETWLSATVEGAGAMTFWCKTSCEHDEDNMFTWDRLMIYTNGVEIAEWRMDGETDWTERALSFEGGVNTVKWVYYKDRTGADGEDCAWIDAMTWTPSEAADPIPAVAVDADAATVNAAVDGAGLVDAAVKVTIGGSAAEYNAFKTWADGVNGVTGDALAGEAAVVANEHAAAAYLLGSERLFENEPTVEIGEVVIAAGESAGTTKMTVAVTIKDGERAVAVDQEKVAAMFEATSDLGDWIGAAKLTPTVTTSGTDASGKMTFVVIPGDGTAAKAFLRIRK